MLCVLNHLVKNPMGNISILFTIAYSMFRQATYKIHLLNNRKGHIPEIFYCCFNPLEHRFFNVTLCPELLTGIQVFIDINF